MELKLASTVETETKPKPKEGSKRKNVSPATARKKQRPCHNCGTEMKKQSGMTNDGLNYVFFKCVGCGSELASTDQLQEIAAQSRALKTYSAKITKWGASLGIRIPKELATTHNITHNEEVVIVPEKGGFRVVPSKKS